MQATRPERGFHDGVRSMWIHTRSSFHSLPHTDLPVNATRWQLCIVGKCWDCGNIYRDQVVAEAHMPWVTRSVVCNTSMEELSRDVSGGTEQQDTTNTCIYDQETSMNNCVKDLFRTCQQGPSKSLQCTCQERSVILVQPNPTPSHLLIR